MAAGLGRTGAEPASPPADAPLPDAVVDCALYLDGVRQTRHGSLADLVKEARKTGGAFVWIGMHDPRPSQFDHIASTFDLHELAVEDALSADQQRPKLERYADMAFMIVRTAGYLEHSELTETSEVIDTGSVRIFVGEHFVITVRRGELTELKSVRADLEANRKQLANGPWAVVHAVFDRVVDTYLEIVAALEVDLDTLEQKAFQRGGGGARIEQVYQLKREVTEFKQAAAPLQWPLTTILDGHTVALSTELRRYFRDVADHHTQVVEMIHGYDDLLNSILQARLAQVGVDQNNDMRKIAAWAGIAAMQTTIAGIYGMNFRFMPELHMKYGYPAVLAVMVLSGVVLYRYLRRAGWL